MSMPKMANNNDVLVTKVATFLPIWQICPYFIYLSIADLFSKNRPKNLLLWHWKSLFWVQVSQFPGDVDDEEHLHREPRRLRHPALCLHHPTCSRWHSHIRLWAKCAQIYFIINIRRWQKMMYNKWLFSVRGCVRDQVRAAVHHSVWDNLRAEVWN